MVKLFAFSLILALTVALNADPRAGASSPTGTLLVMNKGDRTLGVIDSATLRNIENIPITGVTGHEVAAAPDGQRAFVPIYGDSGVGRPGTDGSTLVVVDLASRKTVQTID